MAESSALAEVKSQYHHFIPRFILRNFSHLQQAPNAPKKSKNRGKGKGKKSAPRSRAPEDMVNAIDLSGPEVQITETPVAKTFGLVDMYRDFANAKQHHIEEQLSVLESQAGRIISTIRKDFEAGKQEVWFTRGQRDTLRKFLFIMKYRGSTAHRRFYHGETDCYNASDAIREQDKLTAYMKEKKFHNRIDVWFDNLKAILELKMDPNLKWMEEIRGRIYPDDAEWFINITQQFYLTICTPSVDEDEFLLTQNAYSMHEGPASQEYDPTTGEVIKHVYSQFHLFAPIAPRLIFILRSFLLPNALEDASPNIKEVREAWFHANKIQHSFPERFDSVLKDLPVTKARNSYTEIVGGRLVLTSEKPRSATDKFCFRYFPIGPEHVNKINTLMLQESYKSSTIVFKNRARTQKTLEVYLKHADPFNFLDPITGPERLECVKKLRQAAELLRTVPADDKETLDNSSQFELPSSLPESQVPDKVFDLFKESKEAMKLYTEISGKYSLVRKDFEQARALLYMRIKLDSTSRATSPSEREEARNKFLELYSEFPIQVIWIYLKRIRFMKLGGTMIEPMGTLIDFDLPAGELEGTEDDVIRVRAAFQEKDLARIMHHASFNSFLKRRPGFGLAGKFALYDDGGRRLHEEKCLVFGPQGSIRNCGIPEIEQKANSLPQTTRTISLQEISKSPFNRIFTEDEKNELVMRELLAAEFKNVMAGKLGADDLKILEEILFEIVYPGFDFREVMPVGDKEEIGKGCPLQ